MNTGVTGNGRYAYEFVIRTTGIIQIGWACDKCVFDPEAGTGVGDNVYSYAFDGHRVKKWHGSIDDVSFVQFAGIFVDQLCQVLDVHLHCFLK